MKKVWPILFLLLLTACGGQETPAASAPPAPPNPNLGTYWCTSAVLDGLDLGADGQWLRLEDQGKAVLFMVNEPDDAHWTLNGTTFVLTMGGETVARGTLSNGVLTATLMGMDCVFVKEGVEAPAETKPARPEASPPEDPAVSGTAVFPCYGGLYQVTYSTAVFREAADGLTDLISDTGTQAWITRLDSQEAVDTWLADFEARLNAQTEEYPCQIETPTVAGYPAKVLVYRAPDGWHSEVIVPFGRNMGTAEMPMYAACMTFTGPDWMGVWGQPIQDIVFSLTF